MELPPRPVADVVAGVPVSAWSSPIVLPTYEALRPDPYPMFLEKRVYQGSSGRVYPNPFTDRISDARTPRAWAALHLENEFLRVVILPEIGGRIFLARDLTNGYDLFYRQDVIKPALVGLLGPWISGGVELNWPQHHRPSTYLPTDWAIEEEADGARTAWLSEHDPMQRMKGMHGIRLRPGSSVLELRVRLHNRTPLTQTFLWWANVATEVHDDYESFFPPDVTFVADHARRALVEFPVARSPYYGVDFGARPAAEADLAWYRNIPVPTSYMVTDTAFDFFGGYDHRARAGVVHLANRRIAPGKKQWTWGNDEFGRAWDRELSDDGRPYVELMAGAYTDNQPDFSFLAPGETKWFSQAWCPLREIGPADMATLEAAVSLRLAEGRAKLGVNVTSRRPGSTVVLEGPGGKVLLRRTLDLAPDAPVVLETLVGAGTRPRDLELVVRSADGVELIRHRPIERPDKAIPAPATEPPPPAEIALQEELYLTGLHLAQYRHATREPEAYWREALRRDPGDARSNTAMAAWHLRRGEPEAGEDHARRAIARYTARNPNPPDGEPFYLLGLALRARAGAPGIEPAAATHLREAARDAFAKAAWNSAWAGPAEHALAELATARGDMGAALDHVERSLSAGSGNLRARGLRAALLRRAERPAEAAALAADTLELDPLDPWATWELALAAAGEPAFPFDVQVRLDIVHDYAAAGLLDEAIDLLQRVPAAGDPGAPGADPRELGSAPLVQYTLAWLLDRRGGAGSADARRALEARSRARAADSRWCFPARVEEIAVLEAAIAADPGDARAPHYLGNLLYDRRRHGEAIAHWERAAVLDPASAALQRNLGIAYFNHAGKRGKARAAYRRAVSAEPDNARLRYEADQLEKRLGADPAARLRRLARRPDLVAERDDLAVEWATLLNLAGRHLEALAFILGRRFHPWEGGEGLVAAQYVEAHLRLADRALADRDGATALGHASAARTYPPALGEGKHLLADEHAAIRRIGEARIALGDHAGGSAALREAAAAPRTPNGSTYEAALASRALGDEPGAGELLRGLLRHARAQARREVRVDYFASSLPDLLLFEDDLQERNRVACRYLEALALLGLGRVRAGRRALRDVLAADPAHQGAAGTLATLDRRASPGPRNRPRPRRRPRRPAA
jgi:tetratricopeptide (TPR) repeat protein